MTIPVIASSATTTNNATFTKPSGVVAGDILVALGLTYDITSLQTVTLAGWTQRLTVKDSANGVCAFVIDHKCDGTEGASFTPTMALGTYHDWIVLRLTGCDQTNWYDSGATNSGTTETTTTATGFTTASADELLLIWHAGYVGAGTISSGYTGFTLSAGPMDTINYAYSKSQAVAGATGSPTATLNASTGHWATILAGYKGGVAFGSVARTQTVTTSLVATMPSGITAGDALVAFLTDDTGADNPTFTGWTLLTSGLYNSAGRKLSIWGRIATGSEGASMTVTGLTASFADILVFRYTGTDPTSPFNAYGVAVDTPIVPSITTTVDNCTQVAVSDWDFGATAAAAPSGFTVRYNAGTGNFYGADRVLGAAGATTTSDWTATGNAGTSKATATIALRPYVVSAPPAANPERELGMMMGSPRSHIGAAPLGAPDDVMPAATPEQGFVIGDYNTHVGSSYIGAPSWAVAPEQGLVMGSPLSHIGAAYLGSTDVLDLAAFWRRWSLVTWQTKSLPIIPGTGRDSKVERMWETGQLPSYSGSAFTSKMYVRTGGAWVLNTVTPKVRVGGVWVDATAVHVRIAGAWVQVQ